MCFLTLRCRRTRTILLTSFLLRQLVSNHHHVELCLTAFAFRIINILECVSFGLLSRTTFQIHAHLILRYFGKLLFVIWIRNHFALQICESINETNTEYVHLARFIWNQSSFPICDTPLVFLFMESVNHKCLYTIHCAQVPPALKSQM